MFRILALLVPLAMVAAAGCVATEKSENPLSPTVAGPIDGVNISQPSPLEPAQGIRIATNAQPITLALENASSTGVRPISYRFEVATDLDFANVIFAREDIAPGADGRTSLRLPDALPAGRSYYWRARAQDGANAGPYTYSVVFSIFTPVVIGRPTAHLPAHNSTEPTPLFQFGNSSRSGPVGAIIYNIEVSTQLSFVPLLESWVVGEQPGDQTTLRAPQALPPGSMIYWRVMAYDSEAMSDWSNIGSFLTPPASPTSPSGPPTGGSCSSSGSPQAILECRRNQFPPHMSEGDLVAFLRASATDINRSGTAGGPWGILIKTTGAQCHGYSCDILCLGNGSGQIQRDVLIDAEGSQIPIWGVPRSGSEIAIRTCEPQP